MRKLANLEPQAVFGYFEALAAIPHGSGNTRQLSDWLVQFAEANALPCLQDACGNVIIRKAGTPGYEHSAPVMLQGHIDMVCEKEPDCTIDFARDGLRLQLRDNVITAEGTTLGGDDGIAVAYALAILASDTIPHPPLEAVFTVDEEIGMLGAAALDASSLQARTMLNIDSEEEGCLLVGCAGGVTAVCHLPAARERFCGRPAVLRVEGCLGGHSGVEIDKGRANANQVLGRALWCLGRAAGFRIESVSGGKKDNAIPAAAEASLVFSPETDPACLTETVAELNRALRGEFAVTDPGIRVVLAFDAARESGTAVCASKRRELQVSSYDAAGATADSSENAGASAGRILEHVRETENCPHAISGGQKEVREAMTASATRAVITALYNLPGGIQRMSFAIDGLVQTSLNLGILETGPDGVTMSFSVRSSVESEKREVLNRMQSLMEVLGGSVTCSGDYPAWEYRAESPLRDLMAEVFEEQYGRKPVIQAIHAGVECGLFAGKLPGLDCVSFGPDMKDIHTSRECMDVASVQRTWTYLLEILRRMK